MILLCPGEGLKSMNYECGNQKECRLRQRELFNLLQTVKFWCKIILYRRLLQIFGLEVLFMEMLVFGIAAAVSYWTWPPEHGETGRRVLGCLPPVSLAIILFVLLTMASYDVVGIWVVFYILMGYAWICGGVFMMECLDLSWPFDAVHLDNKAAVFPAAGGFVGVTLIYAGANTGDGPGWWVVLFAAGLIYPSGSAWTVTWAAASVSVLI